jgi:hypothetical protein
MAAALCLCLAAPGVEARGLLGLFADEEIPPPLPRPEAPAAPAAPADPDPPVAWISALRGVSDPEAALYGFVKAGTRIDLGTDGEITLTWFSPCREESIIGGVVSVTASGPRVSGAPAPSTRALSCQPVEQVLPGHGPPAAQPIAINASEPVFHWPAAPGAARLSLMDITGGMPSEIWSAAVSGGAAAYPHEAPLIEEGRTYLIRAEIDGGTAYEARFSYDPGLRYSNAPINALVMLRAGAGP